MRPPENELVALDHDDMYFSDWAREGRLIVIRRSFAFFILSVPSSSSCPIPTLPSMRSRWSDSPRPFNHFCSKRISPVSLCAIRYHCNQANGNVTMSSKVLTLVVQAYSIAKTTNHSLKSGMAPRGGCLGVPEDTEGSALYYQGKQGCLRCVPKTFSKL